MLFYVGLHQPSDAGHFDRAFISINRLRIRKKPVEAKTWILDSGAFTELSNYGLYRTPVDDYAKQINRLRSINPNMVAAVSQDYMCEPWIIKQTGLSIEEHQQRTIERYDQLRPLVRDVYVMPVLQGYKAGDYARHIRMYGDRLGGANYVGVGSICKRNTDVAVIEDVLTAIKTERPSLKLHGFGLKITSLTALSVRSLLYSADSMAWSYAARREGRNQNDWKEATRFNDKIEAMIDEHI